MMGHKALIVVFCAFALSFLVFAPNLNVLPYWVTSNQQLYDFTIIIWMVGFALAFIMASRQ